MIVVNKYTGLVENTEKRYGIGWKGRHAIYKFYKSEQSAYDALRDLGDEFEFKRIENYSDIVSGRTVINPNWIVVEDPQKPHKGFVNGIYNPAEGSAHGSERD